MTFITEREREQAEGRGGEGDGDGEEEGKEEGGWRRRKRIGHKASNILCFYKLEWGEQRKGPQQEGADPGSCWDFSEESPPAAYQQRPQIKLEDSGNI